MAEVILGLAGPLYVAALVGGFGGMALWETLRPMRPASVPLVPRWVSNLGLLFATQLLSRLAGPLLALGSSVLAAVLGWGLLARWALPAVVAVPLGIVALDLVRWAIHRAMHWPGLWRVHRIHHSDLDFDCTIQLRFHPLETLLAGSVAAGAVLLLGLPPLAVLLSELLTVVCGYFSHGNVKLPAPVEALLRRVLVTPDLHRVHHSVRDDESRCNYGVVMSVWDRLFGTYRAEPAQGQLGMQFGVVGLSEPRQLTLARLLVLPFRR